MYLQSLALSLVLEGCCVLQTSEYVQWESPGWFKQSDNAERVYEGFSLKIKVSDQLQFQHMNVSVLFLYLYLAFVFLGNQKCFEDLKQ